MPADGLYVSQRKRVTNNKLKKLSYILEYVYFYLRVNGSVLQITCIKTIDSQM